MAGLNNFMVYKFSRRARFRMAVAFTVIILMQVFLGILICAWSLYICLSVSKHLYSEKAEITFVFTVTGMYGTHIILQYLIGIKICEKCFAKAHKRSTKRHLYFWLATCSNTILNIFILSLMAVKISKHIVRSIRHSMEKGIRHYLKDPVWKHTIDKWQSTLECCGVNDFKDWYEVSWLDKFVLDPNTPLVQSFLLSKDHLHVPVVPWSCCDYHFPMQCFHDPLQQIELSHMWKEQPEFLDGSLYSQGCLDVIRKPIEVSLIGFIFITAVLTINQIVLVVISRFLYTSCRSAVILRDIHGDAPGWLFGRDCFNDIKGRTVSEVLFDLEAAEKKRKGDEEEDEELSDSPPTPTKKLFKRTFRRKKPMVDTDTSDSEPKDPSTPRSILQKSRGMLAKMKSMTTPKSAPDSERDPISSGDEHALMI